MGMYKKSNKDAELWGMQEKDMFGQGTIEPKKVIPLLVP